MKMKQPIITIGRQYGSGGYQVASLLAKELGLKFYDKTILEEASKASHISEALFQEHDEQPNQSFLFHLAMDTYSMRYPTSLSGDIPLNHKIFLAQYKVIQELGEKGGCVIVGRCSDYALSDCKHSLHLFLHGDLEDRVRRIQEKHSLEKEAAKELILREDKRRAAYYNYFTTKKWGSIHSYHSTINTSRFGIKGSVEIIKTMIDSLNLDT